MIRKKKRKPEREGEKRRRGRVGGGGSNEFHASHFQFRCLFCMSLLACSVGLGESCSAHHAARSLHINELQGRLKCRYGAGGQCEVHSMAECSGGSDGVVATVQSGGKGRLRRWAVQSDGAADSPRAAPAGLANEQGEHRYIEI